MKLKLHSSVGVTNDGIWLSGKIRDRPFAIRASEEETYQNVGVGGSALFGLGLRFVKGVDGIFLRPHLLCHYLTWLEKYDLDRLLHFAESLPDAEEWVDQLSESDLFDDADDADSTFLFGDIDGLF